MGSEFDSESEDAFVQKACPCSPGVIASGNEHPQVTDRLRFVSGS